MAILYGAIAYREDRINDYEKEIASWDFVRWYGFPIACPNGGVCDATYRLLLEVGTSEETAKEYVDMVLKAMEHGKCGEHEDFIRMNGPLPAN